MFTIWIFPTIYSFLQAVWILRSGSANTLQREWLWILWLEYNIRWQTDGSGRRRWFRHILATCYTFPTLIPRPPFVLHRLTNRFYIVTKTSKNLNIYYALGFLYKFFVLKRQTCWQIYSGQSWSRFLPNKNFIWPYLFCFLLIVLQNSYKQNLKYKFHLTIFHIY